MNGNAGPIQLLINNKFGENTARPSDIPSSPPCLLIEKQKIIPVCGFLKENELTGFDMLECISCVDNFPEKKSMEIIYHLASIPNETQITLRVILERPDYPVLPEIDSVAGVWKTAGWLEREVYDLSGVTFKGHPDPRRILLPHDWEGHPLRKDYHTGDYYHHVKIDY